MPYISKKKFEEIRQQSFENGYEAAISRMTEIQKTIMEASTEGMIYLSRSGLSRVEKDAATQAQYRMLMEIQEYIHTLEKRAKRVREEAKLPRDMVCIDTTYLFRGEAEALDTVISELRRFIRKARD